MEKTTDQQKLTDAQKRFKELNEVLQSKGRYTESELKEWSELCDILGGISVERKKKKGGSYSYFLADKDGVEMRKLHGYSNGIELNDGKYLFDCCRRLPTYENEDFVVTDHGRYDYTETKGGEEIDIKVILFSNGSIMFDAIKEVESYDYVNDIFILEVEPALVWNKLALKIARDYDDEKPIRCVIDGLGKIIVDFTQQRIRFNWQEDEFVLY